MNQIKIKKHCLFGLRFSGYSFDEIIVFKDLIKDNFSNKHIIIFGANKFDNELKFL